jgi:hypothetical protein
MSIKLPRLIPSDECPVWIFRTPRFRVVACAEREYGFQYDGDDEDGKTQATTRKRGMFATAVYVYLDDEDEPCGADYLNGSVYDRDTWHEFFTAHRDRDPMNRNCEAMRAAHGGNMFIGHYFPDMVRNAVADARSTIAKRRNLPRLRAA